MTDVLSLLMDRVEVSPVGCWIWQRCLVKGYGCWKFNGGSLAHRIVYELLIGPIPEGYQIDHLCKVTRCVNPDHLEPVTPTEHSLRSHISWTHCRRAHPLTPENTRVYYRNGKQERQCRACLRVAKRDQKRRRRALGLPA